MPPRLLTAHAVSPTEVRLGFDVPLEVTASGSALLTTGSVPAVPLRAAAWSVEGETLTLTVAPEMSAGAAYEVIVSGVVDAAGEPVAPPDDRVTFVGYKPPLPADRHVDLWSMLPRHVRRDDTSGDLARFVASLQEVTDLLLAGIDRWTDVFDLERAPEPIVDAMLADLGNPYELALELPAKRRLAASLVQMYRQKGTEIGIVNALRFFLGIEARVVSYAGEALVLGESELGIDWILGPSDRWARYAFDVEVNRVLTDEERRHVRVVVGLLRPGHTHFAILVEPLIPPVEETWILSEGELGATTVLL